MRRVALVLGIAVLAGCTASPPPDEAVPGAERPETSPVQASAEPLHARQGEGRDPIRDGPPIGGPSRAELLRLPDAVPSPEPRSRYGNPHTYVVFGQRYRTLPASRGYVERGIASWYGRKFHERLTSSREPYDMFAMTAAHRSLPLPTYVRVTHLDSGASAVVRVNDRGPFHPGRIIDLSYAAAGKLGIADAGSGPVEVRAIDPGGDGRPRPPPRVARALVQYFVQIGAYADRRNAAKAYTLARRLRPGLASLRRIEQEDRIIHRVRIGPLSGSDETARVLDGLAAAGVRDARVVIEDRGKDTNEDDNVGNHG